MEESNDVRTASLSFVNRQRLIRVLARLFDTDQFLSPFGIRSLSYKHKDEPFHIQVDGEDFVVKYEVNEVVVVEKKKSLISYSLCVHHIRLVNLNRICLAAIVAGVVRFGCR
jgi:hypothetical protein